MGAKCHNRSSILDYVQFVRITQHLSSHFDLYNKVNGTYEYILC